MLARIFSTLVLWTLAITAAVFGGNDGWTLVICILSAAALWELCAILKKMGFKPFSFAAQICNILIFAAPFVFPKLGIAQAQTSGSLAFALCACALACSVLKDPFSDFAKNAVLPTALALLAVPFALQWLSAFCTDAEGAGMAISIIVLASAKFSDVGAYVIGRAFGRAKLSPLISPNKTVEGAIGGIASSACVACAIAWGCSAAFAHFPNIFLIAVCGAAIGAIAIVSDLLESLLKRRAGVKDSGAMLPGIGGALDLADSLLMSAPVGILLMNLIFKI